MPKTFQQPADFESAKTRLEEIADAVSDESLPLDDALDLFEEAVAIGLSVTDYIEDGIVVEDEPAEGELDGPAEAPAPAAPDVPTAPAQPAPAAL